MLATHTDPHRRLRSFGCLIAAVFLLAAAACNDDGIQRENPPDADSGDVGLDGDTADEADEAGTTDIPPPGVPSDIETTLLTSNPRVGEPLEVECYLLDQDGRRISVDDPPEYTLVYSPREDFDSQDADRTLMPVAPGPAQIGCAASSLSLVDDTPEQFEVAPGPPHTARTSLDTDQMTAGETATATCEVFDEFGNELDDVDTSVSLDAMGAGIEIDDHDLTIEKADIYRATCRVDGAQREVGATLEVIPDLPANLTMTPSPQKMLYGLGEVVHFSTIVTDEYGNQIPEAPIDYTVSPAADPFGHARWEFNAEGTYTIEARVDGETKDDQTLSDSVEILVNGDGPAIECDSPSDGTEVDMRAGGSLKFSGSVKDAHGVNSLTVDGESVNVGRNGAYSTQMTTRFGINYVDVTATDTYGEENSRTCAFLVADSWHNPSSYLSDGVSFRMEQEALDDGFHTSWLNSLADIIDAVLDSDELLDQLDTQLMNNNPLKPRSCDWNTWAGCAHYSEINYIRDTDGSPGLRSGDNDVEMDWVDDGMEVDLGLNDIGVRLEIDSSVCGTMTGWLDIDSLDIGMTTDLELSYGQPSASLRQGTLTVNASGVSPDFSGVCGTLADYLEGILQDLYQDQVEDIIKDAVESNINDVLDDLFSSLDISSLDSTFDVPSFSGGGSVGIDFNVRFSHLDVDGPYTSRALLGLGTRFEADTIGHSISSKGVPLPEGDVLLDPTTTDRVAAGVHIGILNHALEAVWRGGLFDTKIGGSLLGGDAPAGTEVELSLDLQPVARLQGSGKVELMLGAATVELTYPGLFDQPVEFQIGAVAETGVSIKNNDTLDFNNITLSEFYFTPTDVSLDSESRDVIESFLKSLFQGVVDRSLNSALPSLPIPSFTITPSIGKYGLPTGQDIGVKRPSLGGTNRHFILEGSFGKQ